MKTSIPQKANRILNIILVVMLLILVRVWHVGVVQHEDKVEEARRPQRRVRIEPAERGTIRDRFNNPLAVNRVQYNAAVLYSEIRDLKTRKQRKEQIKNISTLLSEELGMDAARIEDLIHSKAALFPNVPFVIKADISENSYFRLKMLERDLPGLYAERGSKRFYPQGAVAGELIGYLGAISVEEYEEIAHEMCALKENIEAAEEGQAIQVPEARRRLAELQERAYTFRDQMGKAGVEAMFDEELRGYSGKHAFLQDIYGSYIRQLPGGRDAVAGQRLLLTISSELQEYAEELLMENEEVREGRSHAFDRDTRSYTPLKQPWIKGGAIVVMEPKTGEILTMASYPRSNPNNFAADADHWYETERYLAEIWDGKRPLTREIRDGEEAITLTWENYLDLVGKTTSICTIREAIQDGGDLARLVVDPKRFSDELLDLVGDQTLSDYRTVNQAAIVLSDAVREMAKEGFHHNEFAKWRKTFSRAHLREMREEEDGYERPYLDYLDQAERALFADFWQRHKERIVLEFLRGEFKNEWEQGAHRYTAWSDAFATLQKATRDLPPFQALEYLQTMRQFSDLTEPLQESYRFLRGKQLKDLAAAFYPRYGFGYARSHAYRQAAPQGSVFKVVTAYEALMQRYNKGYSNLNPLTMIDDVHKSRSDPNKWNVGFTTSGQPIPQRYKGGSLLRTHRRNVGEIDLIKALETSSNSYFGLLAADHIADPNDLAEAARLFCYGAKTGVTLPGEYKGYVSEDLATNRTGLYTFVNGQHSIVVTPLQTAVMLSTLVNGGKVFKPGLVHLMAGIEPDRNLTLDRSSFAFHDTLALIGVDLPLFTARDEHLKKSAIAPFKPKVQRTLPIPDPVRNMLLCGMQRVVSGKKGGARSSVIRAYANYPWMVTDYKNLQNQMVGKTGTAEIVESVALNETHIYNHIWFACVSFKPDQISEDHFGEPELVVIVYLRFGDYGREAVPLAAQMIKKWREINSRLL